jgi:hypothetical protein
MHRWKTAFFGLVILLAGLVIGASAAAIYLRQFRPGVAPGIESVNDRTLAALQQELQLDPAQRERIRSILARRLEAIDEIRAEARPRIAREMNELYEEVFAVLDGPQRVKWRESMIRLDEHFRGPHGRGRGMGFGGGRGMGAGPNGRGAMRRPFDYWQQQGPPPDREGGPPYGGVRQVPQQPDASTPQPEADNGD